MPIVTITRYALKVMFKGLPCHPGFETRSHWFENKQWDDLLSERERVRGREEGGRRWREGETERDTEREGTE